MHSICMVWFEQLELHLSDLYYNTLSYDVDVFKLEFRTFFGEEHQTFRLKMFHNLDQLKLKFETENLHEVNVKTCLDVLRTQCWQNDFKDYMYWEIETYKRDLLKYLDILEKCIDKSVIKYGELIFYTDDPGLDWIFAHNFLTRLQKHSSYASGHLEVSELAACLEKASFSYTSGHVKVF
ncbi:hypothetical protein Tco_0153322 [Tanacetum coccineum]